MKKLLRIFVAILFLIFAGVQYNDADGWKWIVAYILPCILFAAWVFEFHLAKAGRILIITYICVALLYVPSFIDWVSSGFPSIVETMQVKKPHIEFVREFLGLILIILSLVYYLRARPDDDDLQHSESN